MLVPASFRCPHHDDVDLTAAVQTQVEGDDRVASLNYRFRRPPPQPFRVVVRCPGGGADGHPVEFSGSYRP